MRTTIGCVAPFLLAVPLFAATIEVQPPNPSSATPVTLFVREYVTCPPPPVIARAGYTINVTLNSGICTTPPVLGTFTFPLGILQPGDYEAVVNPGARSGYAMFFVSDADAQISVEGQSFGPATGGTQVKLIANDAVQCFGPDQNACPLPTVTFNGIQAAVLPDRFARGELVVVAPPNVKGITDVVVTGGRGTRQGRVFRYYDPNGAPPTTMFERVLIPVWTFGPGAFGSNWMTEVNALNATSFDLEPYRRIPPRLPKLSVTPLDFGQSRSGGVLFFPPRDFALEYGSLVRDTSRQADDWGAEVPIVRESEFRTGYFNLLNVPVDPRFRLTLRIYDPDAVGGEIGVTVYSMIDGSQLARGGFQALGVCQRFTPCATDGPATAVVDLLSLFPQLAGTQRVRVQIEPLANRLWAFMTITNNQTQHVTVIAPH